MMRFKRILLFCAALLVFALTLTVVVSKSLAVWNQAGLTPVKNETIDGYGGVWLYKDVYQYDPNATYHQGDIVIKNGVMYHVEKTVRPNSSSHDPENPNTNAWQRMNYTESTHEYRWFHFYQRGDVVVFNGKTYKYDYWHQHWPNTSYQLDPDQAPSRWTLLSNTWDPDIWYTYIIYSKDAVVNHNGQTYKSLIDNNYHIEPGTSSSRWQQI